MFHLGKAQPLESLVLTPTGWTMIKDLRKGDAIIGSHGESVRVTGTYPQGIRQTYWIEFCDGCGVEVSDHHLWLVHDINPGIPPVVLSTLELFHRAKSGIGKRLGRIPVVKPVQYFSESSDHQIDPYTLGVFLSAFNFSLGKLSIRFPSVDFDHYAKFLKCGRHRWSCSETNGYVELIVEESFRSLLSKYLTPASESHCMRIPSELMMAPVTHRVAFLQGLLDISPETNGTLVELGISLRKDVIDIVRSLGGLAFPGTGSHLTLQLQAGLVPFLSPSKQRADTHKSILVPQRYIMNVHPLRKTEVMCISVDAEDHLYVTENVR